MVESVKEDFKSRMINKISLAPMVRMVGYNLIPNLTYRILYLSEF